MEQIPEFIGNHPLLVGGFLLVLVLLIKAEYEHQTSKSYQLTAIGAVRAMNSENAWVLDVRSPAEYKVAHINNAANIPLPELQKKIPELLKKHKESEIVVYCNTGGQSGKACNMLQRAGFSKVHNIAGGLHSWQDAKMPTTKA